MMICDGDGNCIADGVQWYEADQLAQAIADRRGENVWLYADDENAEPKFVPYRVER